MHVYAYMLKTIHQSYYVAKILELYLSAQLDTLIHVRIPTNTVSQEYTF